MRAGIVRRSARRLVEKERARLDHALQDKNAERALAVLRQLRRNVERASGADAADCAGPRGYENSVKRSKKRFQNKCKDVCVTHTSSTLVQPTIDPSVRDHITAIPCPRRTIRESTRASRAAAPAILIVSESATGQNFSRLRAIVRIDP